MAMSPEFMREIQKKSHTPEADAKRAETKRQSQAIRAQIYDFARKSLTGTNKERKVYFEEFMHKVQHEALKDPNSRCGQLLASTIYTPDMLSILDAQMDKMLSRDLDFLRYRIQSQLFDKQKEVINNRISRRVCIMTSRRAGKTELNGRLANDTACQDDSPIFYVHLTSSNAVSQCFDITANCSDTIGLPIEQQSKSTSTNEGAHIRYTNNSIIRFRGNHNKDDIEKLRGFKARTIIVDEAQSQKNLEYLIDYVLEPMLMDYPDSKLYLVGTPPRAKNTYFEKCFRNASWKSYTWDLRDNPFIPNAQEELERICKQKGLDISSPLIQREYLGQIVYDTEAQVFKGYQTYVKRPDFPITNIYIGNDYGWAANNAVVGIACNVPQKKAFIFYSSKFNHATVSQIVEENKKALKLGRDLLIKYNAPIDNIGIYGDTSDNSIIFEMSQTYGLPAFSCYKYNRDIAIAQLAEECRTGRLLIEKDSVLADEFEQILYARDMEDNLTTELDEMYHPDAMFALLYASRQMFFDEGIRIGFD